MLNQGRLSLSASQLYGSSQQKKARQPSGASTIQPIQNSGLPGTADFQKPKGLARPLTGMQSQPKPGTPIAAPTQQNAYYGPQTQQRSPMSWNGPTDPYGRPSGYMKQMPQYQNQMPQMGLVGSKGPRQQTPVPPVTNDPLQQANDYYNQTRQLAQVSRPDFTDYNFKTDLANQRVDANNASMDAMNKHLAAGGGLQANNTTLSNLYGSPIQKEIGSRDAAALNADADRMKAARHVYNQQQDTQFANWRSDQNALYGRQEQPEGSNPDALGLRNGQQAAMDTKGLVGQYQMVAKSGQAKGLKFTDFIQNKIDNGELEPGHDAVKIIAKEYGHEFSDMDPARAKQYAEKWGDPVLAARDLYGQRKAERQQISDDGMAQRQAVAAQLGADRARRADMLARGYSPTQADASIAQQNNLAAQQALQQQQLNAQQDIFSQQLAAKQLEQDAYLRDRALQRAHDALYGKPTQPAGKGKGSSGVNSAAGSTAPSQPSDSKGSKGKASKEPPNPKVQGAVSTITSDPNFKPDDAGSLAIASRQLAAGGLSPAEQVEGLKSIFGDHVGQPEVAQKTIQNIGNAARKEAQGQSRWNDNRSRFDSRVEAGIDGHLRALKALGHAAGMSPDEIAEHVYPEGTGFGGVFDPFLTDKRQKLVDALNAIPTSKE